VGNSLLLVGCGLFSFTPDSFDVPRILYASQIIAGFGAGMMFTVTTFLMSLNADFEDHAIGQGLIAQGRVIGGTLGVAMGSALFSNHIAGLAGVLTPAELATLRATSTNCSPTSICGVLQRVAPHLYVYCSCELVRIAFRVANESSEHTDARERAGSRHSS
jgi:hypothetical protein